jgi:predicted nuclease of restriction endonuclease-like (RecB) superfamily
MKKMRKTPEIPGKLAKVQRPVAQIDGLPKDYPKFISQLKEKVREARLRASLAANSELIKLYWTIGRNIRDRQKKEGWGSKVIDRLSKDLRVEFPDMKGFSTRNINYMRGLAEAYPEASFVQQVVAQIPWGHNVRILDRVKIPKEREWYLMQTLEHAWSRDILVMQIDSGLFERKGKSITNFKKTLPQAQSDLAHQVLKDPYVFDFLSLGNEAQEREVEKELVQHITKFLLELGAGFSFVGKQYHLEVGDDDFYIDLLFYHLNLRCYVVIELKTGKFKPEYAGQLNFYLSAIDDQIRHPDDKPTIGLLLCKDKNKLVAEYALKDISKPIGVSEYKIMKSIPANLKKSLPTVEELEEELG